MPRATYKVNKNGALEPLNIAAAKQIHSVQDDTIEPIESMVDSSRQMFDSKSAYKKHLKENGYEITGGDHLTGNYGGYKKKYEGSLEHNFKEIERKVEWGMLPPTDAMLEAKELANKIKWGMAPCTSEDRERWEKEKKR